MYQQINDVNTWYDVQGEGETLLMLHPGGIGVDSRAFGGSLPAFTPHFRVFLPDRRGHGRTPDSGGAYSYEMMAQDTAALIEQVIGNSPVKVLGMSDGAVVGLLLAKSRPDLVERLVCLAGVYHHEGWWDAIQPMEIPEFLIQSYAAISPDGEEHWSVVHEKLTAMHLAGPKLKREDLEEIRCRTLVMVGDDDEVSLTHATDFYQSLPNGELAVIPGTSHGLLIEKPHLCEPIILDFLTCDPVKTIAPVRRVQHQGD